MNKLKKNKINDCPKNIKVRITFCRGNLWCYTFQNKKGNIRKEKKFKSPRSINFKSYMS